MGRDSAEGTAVTASGEGDGQPAPPGGKKVFTLCEDGPATFLNVRSSARKKRPTCHMSICSPGSSAQPAPTSAAVRAVTVVTGGSPAAGQLSATCLPCHSDPFPSAPTRSSFELAPLLTGHCLCQSHPGKLPSPGVPTVGSPWGLWRVTYFLRPALEATRRC